MEILWHILIVDKLSFGNISRNNKIVKYCLINIMTYTLCVYKKCLCVYNNFYVSL